MDLEHRINALEKQLRLHRVILAIAGLAAATALLVGFKQPSATGQRQLEDLHVATIKATTIQATKLEIIDGYDTPIIRLNTVHNGYRPRKDFGEIHVLDFNGRDLVRIASDPIDAFTGIGGEISTGFVFTDGQAASFGPQPAVSLGAERSGGKFEIASFGPSIASRKGLQITARNGKGAITAATGATTTAQWPPQ
jgi:hypothetical protein